MSIEIKISEKRIPYKTAMLYLNKRVEEVKKESPKVEAKAEKTKKVEDTEKKTVKKETTEVKK